jgi:hypothetical protein
VSSDFTSRTARVPARHYKRRLTISEHAVERFRERVDEEFRHRDDNDLANLLDERLGYAEHTYQVHDPRAPQAVTTLRSVACRNATYYAVVRDETAVTLLDEQMVHNNFDPWIPVEVTPHGLKTLTPPLLPASLAPQQAGDPIAEAGVAYARARQQQYACKEVVAALKAELDHAYEALFAAELAAESAHRRLIDLAGGG